MIPCPGRTIVHKIVLQSARKIGLLRKHADLTLLLHTHQVADGACLLLSAVYLRRLQVLPLLLHTRVADGTAYPYGVWDCLCYSLPMSHAGLPSHARSSCYCVRTDHPAAVEHPEIVPTAIAKEAERGHPGGPFVNLLLVPRVCSLLVSLHAKEGSFRPYFLRPIWSGWP